MVVVIEDHRFAIVRAEVVEELLVRLARVDVQLAVLAEYEEADVGVAQYGQLHGLLDGADLAPLERQRAVGLLIDWGNAYFLYIANTSGERDT